MTNLLIAFPDQSTLVNPTFSEAEDGDNIAENIIYGGRDSRAVSTSTTVTSSDMTWDLGAATTSLPEYVIVAEAHKFTEKLVASSVLDINFDTDDNGSFTTPQNSGESIDSTDLIGPNGEDYFRDLTSDITTAERYHRITIDMNSDSIQHVWSKVYFGTLFDMGRDPTKVAQHRVQYARERSREFSLLWTGISDAKRTEFFNSVTSKASYGGFFLYDPNDYLFSGYKLIHASLVKSTVTTKWKDSNDILCSFKEVL